MHHRLRLCCSLLITSILLSCSSAEPSTPADGPWQLVASELDEAALSVGGSAVDDVWVVGADRGQGPLVLHWDGSAWERKQTGTRGDLWWVHAFDDGTAFFAGSQGTLVQWTGKDFRSLSTPGLARHTLFGVWGRSANDVYAVGSVAGRDGFLWHYDGKVVRELELPRTIPSTSEGEAPGLFKVWGNDRTVYAVGAHGLLLEGDADRGFTLRPTGLDEPLYTVHGSGDRVFVVGGQLSGRVVEVGQQGLPEDATPSGAVVLQGICVGHDGEVIATGERGEIFTQRGDRFERVDTGLDLDVQTLHAVWLDPEDNVWAVGGNAFSGLDRGAIVRRGAKLPGYRAGPPPGPPPQASCPVADIDPRPDASIARRWNEQILAAIRRDLPRPTVHARNLYHLSAAMWDAWAAFEPAVEGVFVDEKLAVTDLEEARRVAISYAAYGVLRHRYAKAIGGDVSEACFRALMKELALDPDEDSTKGSTPAALGRRIAAAVIAAGTKDGANEANDYADTTGFKAANPPLVVESLGTNAVDPAQWQQLNLAEAVTQNGIVTDAGIQGYIGAQWNDVTPFAMTRTKPDALYHVPDVIPSFDAATRAAAVQVVEKTAWLDASDGEELDISPGAYGNNALGQNDGTGHPTNPVTGKPYAPNRVKRGDFARVLAEFWADGPKSETPPGHWNVLANTVADTPGFERRWRGEGEAFDGLAWDVRLYLALNGALHDAAITAWGIKRRYTTARPITLIRAMAGHGQSSDPKLPSYDARGLPLVPGLIELITEQSAAQGERHAHLWRHVGEVAVRSYRGEPAHRDREVGGIGFIRAREWIPYQRRTFVTPAFPGFISGHSTFSRAAAEVLSAATGSPYFPGGLGSFQAKKDAYLVFEQGPSADVRLEWGTYYDAADQAGQSRIFGGIHIEPDDFVGRKLGSQVGLDAIAHAETFFAPSVDAP